MKESSGVSRRTRAASCLAQRPATRGRSQPAKKAAPGLDDPLLLLQPQPQPQPQPRPSSRLFDSASLPRPAASASVVSIRVPDSRLHPRACASSRPRPCPSGRARGRPTHWTSYAGLAPPPTHPGLPASLPTPRQHRPPPGQRRHALSATEAHHRVRHTTRPRPSSSARPLPL